RSATCLTAAILNSSVYRFPLMPSPCAQHYGSGVSTIVVAIHPVHADHRDGVAILGICLYVIRVRIQRDVGCRDADEEQTVQKGEGIKHFLDQWE
ncbi:MAG: hypothetical protein AB1584_05415, partial [Pseudomonadota bacterium]